jgi:5-methylcytosine-specific restriction endonuclease McrA
MEEIVQVFKMPKKITKKSELKILDDTWKQRVKERDNFICQICNMKIVGKNCHAHHILPRQIRTCRWDIDNGITLCYRCHKVGSYSSHMNAIWFAFWLKKNKIKQFEYIVNKLVSFGKK